MEGTPRQQVAALVAMLVLLGGLGLRLWASGEGKFLLGPNHLATDGETLFAHVDGELIEITVRDGVTRRTALEPLGIRDGLADLQVLPDGSLLLGDRAGDRILRCDLAVPKCEAFGPPPGTVDEYFKFHHDAASGVTYLTDTLAHRSRLLAHDAAGVRVAAGTLRFPNAVHLGPDGVLWVADTNGHRLAAYRAGPTPEASPERDLRTMLDAGTGHIWPIAFVPASHGNFWVLVGGPELRDARLAWYSQGGGEDGSMDGAVVEQFALPGARAPSGLALFDGGVVVADPEAMVFYHVAPDEGFRISEWGPPDLLAELDARYARRVHLEHLTTLGAIVVGLGVVGLALVVMWIRHTTPAAPTLPGAPHQPVWKPEQSTPGVRWLARTERSLRIASHARFMRWFQSVRVLAASAAALVFLWSIAPYVGIDPLVYRMLVISFATGTVLLWGYAQVVHALDVRLGVESKACYVDAGQGPVRHPLEEVWFTDTRVLVGGRTVLLGHRGQTLFEPADVAALHAVLDPRRRISEVAFELRALRAGDPLARTTLVYAALVVWWVLVR